MRHRARTLGLPGCGLPIPLHRSPAQTLETQRRIEFRPGNHARGESLPRRRIKDIHGDHREIVRIDVVHLHEKTRRTQETAPIRRVRSIEHVVGIVETRRCCPSVLTAISGGMLEVIHRIVDQRNGIECLSRELEATPGKNTAFSRPDG